MDEGTSSVEIRHYLNRQAHLTSRPSGDLDQEADQSGATLLSKHPPCGWTPTIVAFGSIIVV